MRVRAALDAPIDENADQGAGERDCACAGIGLGVILTDESFPGRSDNVRSDRYGAVSQIDVVPRERDNLTDARTGAGRELDQVDQVKLLQAFVVACSIEEWSELVEGDRCRALRLLADPLELTDGVLLDRVYALRGPSCPIGRRALFSRFLSQPRRAHGQGNAAARPVSPHRCSDPRSSV